MGSESQHAHNMAKKLISSFLGEPAEALLSVMLRIGRAPLPEIARACDLPGKQLRHALLVLLQHNFVRAYLQPEEVFVSGVRAPQYLYEPCTDWVLQLLRRNLLRNTFLQIVHEELIHHGPGLQANPELAQSVLNVLLDHGRLTFDQIIKGVRELQLEAARPRRSGSVRSTSRPPASAAGDDDGAAGGGGDGEEEEDPEAAVSSVQEIRHMVFLMIQQRLIEQAPPCTLPPPTDRVRFPGKRPKKDPKPGTREWSEEQDEARRQRPAQLHASHRFRVPDDLFSDGPAEEMWRGLAISRWALEEGERLRLAGPGGSGGGGARPVKSEAGAAGGSGGGGGSGGRKRRKGAEAEAAVDDEELIESLLGDRGSAARATKAAAAAKQKEKERQKEKAKGRGKRRRVVDDGEEGGEGEEGGGGGAEAGGVRVKEEPGLAAAAAAAAAPGSGKAPILWRANGEELNRRLRNRVCVEWVHDALGGAEATLVAVMLDYSRSYEATLTEETSTQMSEGDIQNALNVAVADERMEAPEQPVADLLRTLEMKGAVGQVGDPALGTAWFVETAEILHRARYNQMLAAVKDRYGAQGVRVLQLLLTRGQLEQKQVADLTMGPQRETRELLYSMMRGGYVEMQLVPRSSDRAPSRSFFTWKIDLGAVHRRMAADALKAAVNVWARYASVMDAHADIVAASRAAFYGGGALNMTDEARPRIARLHVLNQKLLTAQLRLDAQAALFCDYVAPGRGG
ncbi:DNA-directed RNA polymerase III subunit [Raphidocelis subcapitata]|uniref:DNA-directed RNA polymerase III subunit RPC3 n=1 Tax=Raphidocelis subcapitata TaxID=307507 RepID=A0A2V0PKA8_9CHLO|nr:DNA-directed RNA polymerase III subunit [Raphidocelis subcapitata]|eukprot:GBG00157.1 DNA-directed RNA polymerase III subunit [Raphidocelis subcapitata]